MPLDRVDLAVLLGEAADGRFPPVDGGVSRTGPWRDGVEAAVAFTGHAVLAVGEDVDDSALLRLGAHGYGGAHDPRLVTALVGEGEIGVLDVLLWSALAVLMFGAAAHQWFFEGQNDERSRRIAAVLGPEDVAEVMEFANGEIDAVRRLRVAHPGLSLRDAYDLVKHHGDDQG